MNELKGLLAKGLIETVEPDRSLAEQWIEDARRHIQAARAIEAIDPSVLMSCHMTQHANRSRLPC